MRSITQTQAMIETRDDKTQESTMGLVELRFVWINGTPVLVFEVSVKSPREKLMSIRKPRPAIDAVPTTMMMTFDAS